MLEGKYGGTSQCHRAGLPASIRGTKYGTTNLFLPPIKGRTRISSGIYFRHQIGILICKLLRNVSNCSPWGGHSPSAPIRALRAPPSPIPQMRSGAGLQDLRAPHPPSAIKAACAQGEARCQTSIVHTPSGLGKTEVCPGCEGLMLPGDWISKLLSLVPSIKRSSAVSI